MRKLEDAARGWFVSSLFGDCRAGGGFSSGNFGKNLRRAVQHNFAIGASEIEGGEVRPPGFVPDMYRLRFRFHRGWQEWVFSGIDLVEIEDTSKMTPSKIVKLKNFLWEMEAAGLDFEDVHVYITDRYGRATNLFSGMEINYFGETGWRIREGSECHKIRWKERAVGNLFQDSHPREVVNA